MLNLEEDVLICYDGSAILVDSFQDLYGYVWRQDSYLAATSFISTLDMTLLQQLLSCYSTVFRHDPGKPEVHPCQSNMSGKVTRREREREREILSLCLQRMVL